MTQERKSPGRASKYMNEAAVAGESGLEVYTVSHNLLLAHAEAIGVFRNNPKVRIQHIWFCYIKHLKSLVRHIYWQYCFCLNPSVKMARLVSRIVLSGLSLLTWTALMTKKLVNEPWNSCLDGECFSHQNIKHTHTFLTHDRIWISWNLWDNKYL